MQKVYLCFKNGGYKRNPNRNNTPTVYNNYPASYIEPELPYKFITDELDLAQHIKENWACYIMNGLTKVESVETTVIEKPNGE